MSEETQVSILSDNAPARCVSRVSGHANRCHRNRQKPPQCIFDIMLGMDFVPCLCLPHGEPAARQRTEVRARMLDVHFFILDTGLRHLY